MDKTTLLERQEQVKAIFDDTVAQIKKLKAQIKSLSEESYRYQGEYRILTEFLNNLPDDNVAEDNKALKVKK